MRLNKRGGPVRVRPKHKRAPSTDERDRNHGGSMALTINANVASLNAQRHLAETTSLLNKSIERLSSGLRINSASDDAAGLAIADKLRADSRIASQAIRNANDGISALSIGEQA